MEATYTLCITAGIDATTMLPAYDALIRRNIQGGIDGPFTETQTFATLAEAIAIVVPFNLGLPETGLNIEGTTDYAGRAVSETKLVQVP